MERGLYSAVLLDSISGILVSENRGGDPHLKGVSRMYEMEFVRGHVEVYLDGVFCFSADTRGEAERELAELTA